MKIQVTQDHIDKGVPRLPDRCLVSLAIQEQFSEKVMVGSLSYSIGEYNGRFIDSAHARIIQYDLGHGMTPFELEIDYVDTSNTETH